MTNRLLKSVNAASLGKTAEARVRAYYKSISNIPNNAKEQRILDEFFNSRPLAYKEIIKIYKKENRWL